MRKYTRAYKFRYNSIFYNHVQIWIRQATRGKTRYYSVVDAIAGLAGSKNPRDYWYHVKNRPMGTDRLQLSTLCRQLRLKGPDGKYYLTDSIDKKGLNLIIQAFPLRAAAHSSDGKDIISMTYKRRLTKRLTINARTS